VRQAANLRGSDTLRVLISGAQGFIGRYTVAALLQRFPESQLLGIGRSIAQNSHFTHRIRVLKREIPAPMPAALTAVLSAALDSGRYSYRPLDVCDLEAMRNCLRRFSPTAIVHLAGALRGEPLARLLTLNVAATSTLFDAIADTLADAPRVIHASSGSVYGVALPDSLPVSEHHSPHPFDDYSISKHAGELVGEARAKRQGIDYLRARIFNVVGPGQDERHICGRIASGIVAIEHGAASSLRLGNLKTTRDFIDVRDVASSLASLIEHGAPDHIYNVASGRETAMSEVVTEMSTLAGIRCPPIDPIPHRPDDNPRMFADISRIAALSEHPARSLEASCGDILDYYRHLVASEASESNKSTEAFVTVQVDRHDEYRIHVAAGLVETLPALLRADYPNATIAILTDERVWELYGEALARRLQSLGAEVTSVRVAVGDESKSFETFHTVIESLHAAGLDRHGLLVNLGGGMISDLGGFVASAYLRGVSYVNVPTTLLGQCDAAIGGKVAINMPWAKNFVGAFHQPAAVFVDPLLLHTLQRRDLAAGLAEIIKVAIIADAGLFRDLEEHVSVILDDRDPLVLQRIVLAAGKTKVRLLAPDPHERDLRRVLNFGHTFGHPLETEYGYAGLLHGEAVAWGMLVSTMLAESRNLVDRETVARISGLIASFGLPPAVPIETLHSALRHLASVRLVRANKLHFVLPTAIGAATIIDEVADDELLAAIDAVVDRIDAAVSLATVRPGRSR